jgi:DNA polymerase-1
MMASRVVLIDGSSLIFRAYYAIPGSFTTASGLHTNATYGFALMFRKILEGKTPEYAAVVFDAPGKTFRDEKFPEYKAHRPKMDDDLVEQLEWIDRVVEVHDFPVLRVEGYEADDVIGTLARMAVQDGHEVRIISADKDFGQLITDRIKMIDTMRDITYDPEVVRKKWGVPPEQMRDYLALVGDKSDNVPGVAGVGKKTAKTLLKNYGDLDAILEAADAGELSGRQKNVAKHRDDAVLSRDLVTIDEEVPLDVGLADLKITPPDPTRINDLYRELEFNSLLAAEDQEGIDGIDTEHFELVDSLEELKSLLEHLKGKKVALQPLYEPWDHMRGEIVGIGLGLAKGTAWYVPVRDDYHEPLHAFIEDPDQPKVVHNLRDIYCLFARHEVELRGVVLDTQLASFLNDPTKIIPHDLDQVVKEYLQRTMKPLKQLVGGGKSQKRIDDVDLEETTAWACHVAAAIAELREPIEARLADEGHVDLLHDFAMPMAYLLAEMQLTGIRVDTDDLAAMEEEFEERKADIEAKIHELAGHEFNVGSPKQLGEVLFDEIGLRVIKRTKTGYSTAADVLERLDDEHEIPGLVLRWRSLAKLINTYTRVLRESVNPDTGRVHATFQQTTGASGRIITTNPDLQRTPTRGEDGKRIRKAFVPRDGWVMISADWSQIELRMLAHFSQDEALLESFRENIDLHRRTASRLFDVDPEEVTPKQRNMGKTVNFATIYGQGATALGQQLDVKRSDAKRMIERYFEEYAGVREWLDGMIARAHETGYVETLIGRRRYIPELLSNNPSDRSYGERVAANTPIQGSAADLCKMAMMQIRDRFREEKLETVMTLQIHDELLFESPPDELDTAIAIIRDRMEHACELSVPLEVDIGTGQSWAEAH